MYQSSCQQTTYFPLLATLQSRANASAILYGSPDYPDIYGVVKFYQTGRGVLVYSEITGLPSSSQSSVLGYHIHEGNSCNGNPDDPFSAAMSHYNPDHYEHPYHAGDMPPLFSSQGFALSLFLTDRFWIKEIIGKTVIIHDSPDDFVSQPSGNSGRRIACGIIQSC